MAKNRATRKKNAFFCCIWWIFRTNKRYMIFASVCSWIVALGIFKFFINFYGSVWHCSDISKSVRENGCICVCIWCNRIEIRWKIVVWYSERRWQLATITNVHAIAFIPFLTALHHTRIKYIEMDCKIFSIYAFCTVSYIHMHCVFRFGCMLW